MATKKTYLNLFVNKFKKQDNHPDYGNRFVADFSLTIEPGKCYELAGWRKEEGGGISISIAEMTGEYAERLLSEHNTHRQITEKETSRQTEIFPKREDVSNQFRKPETVKQVELPKDDDLPF